jgi:predicted GNAT family acetyltransferase
MGPLHAAREQPEELAVVDNAEERRFEAHIGSERVGVIRYEAQPGVITLVHTEVEPAFEGKGVGSRLIAGALDDIRRRDLSLVPVCPFVRAYLERHPEYADLIAPT